MRILGKKYDIMAIGECLIDFVSKDLDGRLSLEGSPGGAPANVAAMAARLGYSTAMVAKVGADQFGVFMENSLKSAKIDCSHIIKTDKYPTTLAMVSLDETGNRSFTFYRNQSADVMLRADEIPYNDIAETKIVHFGSVSLTSEPARTANFEAVGFAREKGCIISYDPNLRKLLWESEEEARRVISEGLSLCDIAKISEEELSFLTGIDDIEAASKELYEQYNMAFLFVTMGPSGCACRFRKRINYAKAYDVKCVDTTGAGDAFCGAALSWILGRGFLFHEYTNDDIEDLIKFANAAGSLATSKMGAIPAMPTLAEIEQCMANVPFMEKRG